MKPAKRSVLLRPTDRSWFY